MQLIRHSRLQLNCTKVKDTAKLDSSLNSRRLLEKDRDVLRKWKVGFETVQDWAWEWNGEPTRSVSLTGSSCSLRRSQETSAGVWPSLYPSYSGIWPDTFCVASHSLQIYLYSFWNSYIHGLWKGVSQAFTRSRIVERLFLFLLSCTQFTEMSSINWSMKESPQGKKCYHECRVTKPQLYLPNLQNLTKAK